MLQQTGFVLSASQLDYLVAVVRRILLNSSCRDRGDLDPGGWPHDVEMVNITLRHNGQLCASMSGRHRHLPLAVERAAVSCLTDHCFANSSVSAVIDKGVIEFWFQRSKWTLGPEEKEAFESSFTMGQHGIEITQNRAYAYFKPSVALTSAFESPKALMRRLCTKAGISPDGWMSTDACVQLSNWEHYAYLPTSGKVEKIDRMRIDRSPSLAHKAVKESIEDAVRRLARSQESSGRFAYVYDPFADSVSNRNYNLVRHAGCIYALAWAAAEVDDGDVRRLCEWACSNAISHLLDFYVYDDSIGITYFQDSSTHVCRDGKLGTIALALLAVSIRSTLNHLQSLACSLEHSILSMQVPNGGFRTYAIGSEVGTDNEDFFPGEALLAICRRSQQTNRRPEDRVMETSFEYYTEHFRRRPVTAFVLWQVDAWRLYHSLCCGNSSSRYSDFVFEMTDWLLQFQHSDTNSDSKNYLGGFSFPGRPKYSSATFTEAVVRAYQLAVAVGDNGRASKYLKSARLGLTFVRRLQIARGSEGFFPNPKLAVGGVTESLESFRVRCDFDQHFITALLAANESPELFDSA